MNINIKSYANVLADLSRETHNQLLKIDEKAPDLNEHGGVDAFAEIHFGNGLYLTVQLTCTLSRRSRDGGEIVKSSRTDDEAR